MRCSRGEAHDHCKLWQVSCNHWLLEKKIFPNQGLTHFRRVNASDTYNPDKGLSYPSLKDQQERNDQVKQWQRKLERLEKEASMSRLFD